MASTAMHHGFQVISTAEHVPLARREAAKVLASWGMSEQVVDTACLTISELMTNVVQHTVVLSPTATVILAVEEEAALVLVVADAHPLRPKPLPAAHGVGGRGLFLVDALVREVSDTAEVVADIATGGKRILIRLPPVPVRPDSARHAAEALCRNFRHEKGKR